MQPSNGNPAKLIGKPTVHQIKPDIGYWYLHNHKIFSQLNTDQLKELAIQVGFLKLKKNQTVSLIEDNVDRIYFLKKGCLKIVRENEGKEVTVDLISEEDVFGQIPSVERESSLDEYAKVVSPEAIICTFTKEKFELLLNNYPSVCLTYSRNIGEKLLVIKQKYSDLIYKDVKTRLKEFLVQYSKSNSTDSGSNLTFRNNFTHQDIADLIGSRRQTVSSLLKEMQRDGEIDYNRKEIVIKQWVNTSILIAK